MPFSSRKEQVDDVVDDHYRDRDALLADPDFGVLGCK